jgi:hypothetical protein
MLSTKSPAIAVAVLVTATLTLTSCSAGEEPMPSPTSVPTFAEVGTRAFEYTELKQLADNASAIVLVSPTGKTSDRALPERHGGTEDSAPTEYVEMRVERVLSGSVSDEVIEVVSPGIDAVTGEIALAAGGPFVIFVAPAMYEADDPAGGYAIVGGPAGVYASDGSEFVRVDHESPLLPKTVRAEASALPQVTRTEAELLAIGPRG